jgi:uncharacterized protein (DUF4415 family)
MSVKSTFVRHSLSEVEALRERGEDPTRPDAPEAESLDAEFWKSTRVVMPSGKTSVHLRLDSDVVDWFKARGKGHLTRMNAVLRAYVETQKRCMESPLPRR